jgi:perosamine synthetase
MYVPMSSPDLTEAESLAVREVLRTRYLSIGPKVDAFEQAIRSFVGASFGVAVNSGTSGLHLAVIAAGVQEGDLVITTPFSFVASANCILYERAIPIFVDVDPQTLNIDPSQIAAAIRDLNQGGRAAHRWLPRNLPGANAVSHRVKAILPVDAFGQPADYDAIHRIAEQYGVIVIEDSCEAIGAEYKGRKAGVLGDVGVFAFYPNKQMTTGEGGIIVTDNRDWAQLFRSLRNQGRDVFDAWLNHTRLGFNYRMDEMSAALGLAQLERLDELLAKRQKIADWYNARLAHVPGVDIPYITGNTTRMSWFVYVVRIVPPADRNWIMAALNERGIPSRPYFTPIHLQPFYVQQFGYERGDFPETEKAGDICLALPFSSVMTEQQVEYVCETLKALLAAKLS